MKTINIELLEKAADELRSIKDGKGDLRIGGRMAAAKALQSIDSIFENIEGQLLNIENLEETK